MNTKNMKYHIQKLIEASMDYAFIGSARPDERPEVERIFNYRKQTIYNKLDLGKIRPKVEYKNTALTLEEYLYE